ncbi:hypothetical protein C8A05DRAFT_31551 [Staphylotrichum tortipilum]|uniref:Ankyrin repeat domain-containing protein n=1 Tax=Staphylotrichum tortipilum TaxID=2831512 RepID=A0AAN6MPE9_9PEZI|nr:hypothetical protein C8A05DRAFT_31551 [Staphylotrichum longicolle]
MLLAGCDINATNDLYWHSPPVLAAAWRKRLSTMEFLLSSEVKPDLSITNEFGDTTLTIAANQGPPGMLFKHRYQHKVADILIQAEADFSGGSTFTYSAQPPLLVAAEQDSMECVRVLLAYGADPNVECSSVTTLYEADRPDIVQLLLNHDPKPVLDTVPIDQLNHANQAQ